MDAPGCRHAPMATRCFGSLTRARPNLQRSEDALDVTHPPALSSLASIPTLFLPCASSCMRSLMLQCCTAQQQRAMQHAARVATWYSTLQLCTAQPHRCAAWQRVVRGADVRTILQRYDARLTERISFPRERARRTRSTLCWREGPLLASATALRAIFAHYASLDMAALSGSATPGTRAVPVQRTSTRHTNVATQRTMLQRNTPCCNINTYRT